MNKLKSALKLSVLCAGLLFVKPLNAQVGINTENPQATLDVVQKDKTVPGQAIRIDDGNQGAGKVLTSDADGVGSWQELPKTQLSSTLLNVIRYKIEQVNSDYVNNFDTKIPVSDWVVFMTDFSFDPKPSTTNGADRFIIPDRTSLSVTASPDIQSPLNIYAFENGETWSLSMDYAEGKTYPLNGNSNTPRNGTWEVTVIAVHKSMAKVISTRQNPTHANLGGTSIGAAGQSPI
ncbi:MAG: hypothetical protein LBS01_04740 [Prevotellaceae bacterium]|nr:hypothetical protein [Prevotellaceae bacterium]